MARKMDGKIRARRVAGQVVRATRWGPAQRVRANRQWNDAVEEEFLDRLAASCNVTLACEQAGVGHTSVYRQRRTRADFAMKWQAALEQGYAGLEMALVAAASSALTGEKMERDVSIAAVSAETALKLLQFHRASVTGQGARSGWQAPPKRLDEVRASIIRKIEAIERGAKE